LYSIKTSHKESQKAQKTQRKLDADCADLSGEASAESDYTEGHGLTRHFVLAAKNICPKTKNSSAVGGANFDSLLVAEFSLTKPNNVV